MKDTLKRTPVRTRTIVFGAYFLLLLAMALFPPFYLSASGQSAIVAGIPLPFVYWISNAFLVGLGVWALYAVESINGELPDEEVSK